MVHEPCARVLHQHRLAEGVAAAREQRVRDLLDRAVDRLDDRDACCSSAVPLAQPPLAEDVGRRTRRSAAAPGQHHQHAQARARGAGARCVRVRRLRQHRLRSPRAARRTRRRAAPSSHGSTQMVMASGSQTSRPARRYFFTRRSWRRRLPAPARRPPVRRRWRRRAAAACRRRGGSGAWRRRPAAGRRGAAGAASAAPSLAASLPALLPPRKSVTYQPEPLSWKPAAVTCLAKAAAPQAGQMRQHRVGHLLQHVLRVAAGRAAVGVDRHGAW